MTADRGHAPETAATPATRWAAVAGDLSLDRWEAAWRVLSVACDAGRADVAAMSATALVELRLDDWPAPRAAAAFAPMLRAAELV